jgi:hypothetical protein
MTVQALQEEINGKKTGKMLLCWTEIQRVNFERKKKKLPVVSCERPTYWFSLVLKCSNYGF